MSQRITYTLVGGPWDGGRLTITGALDGDRWRLPRPAEWEAAMAKRDPDEPPRRELFSYEVRGTELVYIPAI